MGRDISLKTDGYPIEDKVLAEATSSNSLIKSDEPQKIVNRIVFIISGTLILLLIGLVIYFVKMRNSTLKITRTNRS